MDRPGFAVALGVRVHARDGAPLTDERAAQELRRAAAAFVGAEPELVAGPSSVTHDAILVIGLTSPEAVVPAALAMTRELRPSPTTFCSAVVARGSDPIEAELLATGAAANTCLARIHETDPREARALIVGPEVDGLAGTLLGLLLEAHDGMTERQRQIVDLMRSSRTQQAVATHLDVSRQAINQSLASAGWPYLKRAEDVLTQYLASAARETVRA